MAEKDKKDKDCGDIEGELEKKRETFTAKETFMDSSISYPTYGRGLKPNINMITFYFMFSI